ncbi:MAG TPA: acyl-CoA thioesterase [Polyangiaceae bacterium]|nr:acyl-CoA thioesterase [Polyangiaceae bacterium]
MAASVHELEVLIVERHLDTFGHVNNATYLDLFEAARWDWITRNGYGLATIQKLGQGPTILEAHLKFKRELLNRESIVIRSWVESYAGKVGTMVQQMFKHGSTLCCEARFVMGLFDLQQRRLVLPTPEWKRALGLTEDGA